MSNKITKRRQRTPATIAETPTGNWAPDLTSRELATVLAALRYWQREGIHSGGHEQDIATDGDGLIPLTGSEIDELCERLNVEETR